MTWLSSTAVRWHIYLINTAQSCRSVTRLSRLHPGTTPTAVQLAGVYEQQKDAFDGRVLRQTGVPRRTRWRRCACCTRWRIAISGATKLQRVKATHGACGKHSMTHLARYPVIRLEVTRLMTLLLFSKTKSSEFGHLLLRRPSTTFHTEPRQHWKIGLLWPPRKSQNWSVLLRIKLASLIQTPRGWWRTCRDFCLFISLLFNKSLTAGCYPAAFKEALVRPLLKKVGLDASDQKNFWPVSNHHHHHLWVL